MRCLSFTAFALVVCGSLGIAEAKQYTRKIQGREVVVHTNPLPVVLHRMVPPQHGRHVTERELQQGKAPQPNRYLGNTAGR
ncbi:MAG: hypothetical protein NTV29_13325 [Planctomycetota bacterium]|nr:hypothetical protein [Planctomycetota bacterium]